MAKRIVKVNSYQAANLLADPNKVNPVTVSYKVVGGTEGPLTLKQKIQSAYKAVVAFVGTLLTLITQVQVLTPFLPEQYRSWIGLAVAGLTLASTFLIQNQEFVERL